MKKNEKIIKVILKLNTSKQIIIAAKVIVSKNNLIRDKRAKQKWFVSSTIFFIISEDLAEK